MEQLNGVCEQSATICLMATSTGCVSKNRAVSMALGVRKQLHHAELGGVSRKCCISPSNVAP